MNRYLKLAKNCEKVTDNEVGSIDDRRQTIEHSFVQKARQHDRYLCQIKKFLENSTERQASSAEVLDLPEFSDAQCSRRKKEKRKSF